MFTNTHLASSCVASVVQRGEQSLSYTISLLSVQWTVQPLVDNYDEDDECQRDKQAMVGI